MSSIYLVGSLRNPQVPHVANMLRQAGHYVFDDWAASGEKGDEYWMAYERNRGRSFLEALKGHAVRNQFTFDKTHLDECDTVVIVLPCGKSAHMELGYAIGRGKRGYVLLDQEPERWDMMYLLASGVVDSLDNLLAIL